MDKSVEFLTPERCCLFVVDPQVKLMAAIHKADRVIKNAALLIHCAKALSIPIIASTQYKKGLGPLVPELAALLAEVPIGDKTEFNALANPGIKELLAALPDTVDTLLLAGAEAHICIYQTALGGLQAGYRPWIVADAVSSREKSNHRLALARMQALGMAVGPAEMVIYELLHKAGTEPFKAMLPHFK
jgi:nicotinamidase-related amidase